MNESRFDRLDALISLAIESCIDQDVETFRAIEENPPNKRIERKIQHLIKQKQNEHKYKYVVKAIKVAGIACLISVSITFTACVSIPKIRNAMWRAAVEWYDEYIAVKFRKGENTSSLKEPPSKIEGINAPTYMPDGYSATSYMTTASFYQEYYNEDGNLLYFFIQGIRDKEIIEVDQTDLQTTLVDINGTEGVITVDEDGSVSLVWQDQFYSYMIQGYFSSQEELIKIAVSVPFLK